MVQCPSVCPIRPLQQRAAGFLLWARRVRDTARLLHVPWASAHRGKWGQLTPWKNDEKLKSENMQKVQFSEWGVVVG